jgi:hypothetical protein
MRSVLPVVAAALLSAGCGARSSLPEGGPADIPPGGGLLLTQGTLTKWVSPVDRDRDVVAFYDYTSDSGHTGFEALEKSELFFYSDTTTGIVSLVTEHGIDQNSSGLAQPEGLVDQTFSGLPDGVTIAVADDNSMEFFMPSPTTAQGKWQFDLNTDGGALTGFPVPGSWSVKITADFIEGIDAWRFFGPEEIPLDLTEPVTLTAYEAD